jgi:hypothetical protein
MSRYAAEEIIMAELTSGGTTGTPAQAGTSGGGGVAVATGQATYTVGTTGSGPGIEGVLDITNGDWPIAGNQIYMSLNAQGIDGQTERVANDGSWLHDFAPRETRNVSQFLQADPGRWSVSITLQDASGQTLADTDPQEITVGGAVHHAQAFQDQALDYTIDVERIHARQAVVTVEYRIHNIGSAPIPAGFPITIAYLEPDGGAGSNQVYAIEVPVQPEQAGAKHLTVEGANTHAAGDTSQLWLTGDGGGAAEKTFQFTVNWESAEAATATPA